MNNLDSPEEFTVVDRLVNEFLDGLLETQKRYTWELAQKRLPLDLLLRGSGGSSHLHRWPPGISRYLPFGFVLYLSILLRGQSFDAAGRACGVTEQRMRRACSDREIDGDHSPVFLGYIRGQDSRDPCLHRISMLPPLFARLTRQNLLNAWIWARCRGHDDERRRRHAPHSFALYRSVKGSWPALFPNLPLEDEGEISAGLEHVPDEQLLLVSGDFLDKRIPGWRDRKGFCQLDLREISYLAQLFGRKLGAR